MIFDQYCIKKLVPRPKLSEKMICGLQNAYFQLEMVKIRGFDRNSEKMARI